MRGPSLSWWPLPTRALTVGLGVAVAAVSLVAGILVGRASDPVPLTVPSRTVVVDGPAAVRLSPRINLLGDTTSDMSYQACSALLRQSPGVEAAGSSSSRTSVTGSTPGTFGRGGTSPGTTLGCVRNGVLNIVLADLDGDTLPEVVTHRVSGATDIAWNQGGRFVTVNVPALSKHNDYDLSKFVPATGGQSPPQAVKLFEQMTAVAAVDANDDGHLDLVLLPSTDDPQLRVLLLDGTRTIPDSAVVVPTEAWPGVPDTVQLEDVNGDGVSDLLFSLRTNLATFSRQDVYAVRLLASTGGTAPFFREETSARMPKNYPNGNLNTPRDGARSSTQRQPLQPFTIAPADYDNDGDIDLFVGGEVSGSRFYRNDGDVWVDATEGAQISQSTSGMGTRALDINDDGNMDVFSTENSYDFYDCPYGSTGCSSADRGNLMFLGNGGDSFFDSAPALGLAHTGFAWGFSTTDLNGDGYLDFFIGAGESADEKAQSGWEGAFDKPALLLGGPGGWVDRSGDVWRSVLLPGSSVVVASADFDGDLRADLLVMGRESSAPLLLYNRSDTGRTAGLLVAGKGRSGSPRFGESSVVRVAVPGRPVYRFTTSGFLSNYKVEGVNLPIPLGLGDSETAEVTVTFPSGASVTRTVRAGMVNRISEP